MRITSIGLYSEENEIANFDFEDPMANRPYIARNIVGLDADEIIPKFYGFSTTNRNKLYDFSMRPREIVIRIGLNPDRSISQSYSTLRDDLYKAISSVRTGLVDLRFNSGVPWFAYIRGFITKMEVPLFSKTPEVQLTLYCEDPIFKGLTESVMLPGSSPTGFEPFVVVDYNSTAPHGFELELTINSPLSEFSIMDAVTRSTDPDWKFRVIYGFLAGDTLTVNSKTGSRAVYVTRSGSAIPIADKIAPESVWPLIFPGTNEITFSNPSNVSLVHLKYIPEFWGI